ncbi:MAG: Fic family protein, partial [Bacilli bacterium]|nr:Fic family protein [Bacilli bacterium]
MAGIELGARWTDEKYATKSDLVANLHTSLIDQLWERVESYRRTYQKSLSLRTLTQHSFKITLTPIINHRISEFEKRLDALRREYEALGDAPKIQTRVCSFSKLEMLRSIAEIDNVRIPDISLKAMLNGTYRESDLTHQPVLCYRDALSYLEKNFTQPLTEDLLAEIYGLLLGQRELTSFYRLENPKTVYNTVQVNRDYYYAPAESLNYQMEAFFSFLVNDPCDFFVKAIAAFYAIIYLKPFDRHNEAVASLLAKFILAQSGLGEAATLIPLESILRPSRKRFKELFLETQR